MSLECMCVNVYARGTKMKKGPVQVNDRRNQRVLLCELISNISRTSLFCYVCRCSCLSTKKHSLRALALAFQFTMYILQPHRILHCHFPLLPRHVLPLLPPRVVSTHKSSLASYPFSLPSSSIYSPTLPIMTNKLHLDAPPPATSFSLSLSCR
jgi:hypothetical protein